MSTPREYRIIERAEMFVVQMRDAEGEEWADSQDSRPDETIEMATIAKRYLMAKDPRQPFEVVG